MAHERESPSVEVVVTECRTHEKSYLDRKPVVRIDIGGDELRSMAHRGCNSFRRGRRYGSQWESPLSFLSVFLILRRCPPSPQHSLFLIAMVLVHLDLTDIVVWDKGSERMVTKLSMRKTSAIVNSVAISTIPDLNNLSITDSVENRSPR